MFKRSSFLAGITLLTLVGGMILPYAALLPVKEAHAALPANELWRENLISQHVGFGTPTGGQGGTLCQVTNLNDSGAGSLRACAEAVGTQWITFAVNGTIHLTAMIRPKSNKTIDGRGADITISGCGFEIGEWSTRPNVVNNIIIENLRFENMDVWTSSDGHGNCGGFVIIAEQATNIWVDHNNFHNSLDELIYVGSNGSDPNGGSTGTPPSGVTISWNYALESNYGQGGYSFGDPSCSSDGGATMGWCDKFLLISDPTLPVDNNATVTIHHNHYLSAHRHPYMRWMRVHSFNNYYHNNHGDSAYDGASLEVGSKFFSENDIFEGSGGGGIYGPRVKVDTSFGDGIIAKVTNPWRVLGNETYTERNPGSMFDPHTFYSYTPDVANATLRTNIINTAGWQNVMTPSPTPTPTPSPTPTPTATPTSCTPTTLNMSSAASDSGFAWIVNQPSFGTPADTSAFPTQSLLRLFENGIQIGPAHSLHADIRNLGQGRFSHWSSDNNASQSIIFSATNNTDPRTNGRTYTYCIGTPPTVSSISTSPSDVDPATPGNQQYQNSTVTYSATASDPDGNPLSWAWYYAINGGSYTTHSTGSGTILNAVYTYAAGTAGQIYNWLLRVTDGINTTDSTLNVNVIAQPTPTPTPSPTPPACTPTTLNVSSVATDGGFAWQTQTPTSFGTPADTSASPTISTLRLFENGTELGPPHSTHADIRNLGQGRFSHWSSDSNATQSIRFSATNNSDPRTNGRTYTYTTGCTPVVPTPTPTATPTPTPVPIACSQYTPSSTIPTGYASPYDVVSSPSTNLMNATCLNLTDARLDLGKGDPLQYIYNQGYLFKTGGTQWSPISYTSSEQLIANAWYPKSATTNITLTQTELQNPNYNLAYICSWTVSSWKCGCRDSACTQSYWQIQSFKR